MSKFQTVAKAICPCGKKCAFGYIDGDPAAVHQIPVCAQYAALEVDEYLAWINSKLMEKLDFGPLQ